MKEHVINVSYGVDITLKLLDSVLNDCTWDSGIDFTISHLFNTIHVTENIEFLCNLYTCLTDTKDVLSNCFYESKDMKYEFIYGVFISHINIEYKITKSKISIPISPSRVIFLSEKIKEFFVQNDIENLLKDFLSYYSKNKEENNV